MIQHHMIGLGKERGLARERRVLVEDNLKEMWRKNWRTVDFFPWLNLWNILRVFFRLGIAGVLRVLGECLKHLKVGAADAQHVVATAEIVFDIFLEKFMKLQRKNGAKSSLPFSDHVSTRHRHKTESIY